MTSAPHAYQQYGIDRIIQDPTIALFWEMGLGKTRVVLQAIKDLKYNRWQVQRTLVIAPKKVAEATWTAEAQKWDDLQDIQVIPVTGTEKQRIKALAAVGDVWVIGRDSVKWLVEYYRHDWPFDMVVIDESSSFKNSQSQRFKALRLVRSRIRRIVELTGTPAPNGMEDLWAQLFLLDGGARLGRTLTSYRDTFFKQDYAHAGQQYRTYTLRAGADTEIRDAISDICISLKADDYLHLPACIEETVPVALDPAAEKAYKKLEKEMLLEVQEDTITAGSAAVLNGKLLQLCSGTVYDATHKAVHIHDCKVEAFGELIEQLNGEHALVFYWFQHERSRLLEKLQGSGLRVRAYDNAADERAWNAGEVDILLAHPASCAYGLNLQEGGHHAIWFGFPNWNLELYQQANARLHRQGQQHPVIIHHMVVLTGMDAAVLDALHTKGDGQEELMQAIKARIVEAKNNKKGVEA